MANKVKFGLTNVHVAPITEQTSTTITYDTIFEVPGAVNLTLDPEGESADFYADNTKYFSDEANNGYKGNLEMALIPDIFRKKILGETVDSNGALVETSNDVIKPFALGFQINGDKTNRKYWLYNVSTGRPSTNAQTTENKNEPKTDSLSLSAMPRLKDGKVRTFLEKTSDNETAYNSFFQNVYESVVSG